MARRSLCGIGPASSTGSPMTLMMRPSVPSPTGTAIARPVSDTSWPRTRPSVESMAMVRTEFSPRCCATSSTRRLPRFCVSSALRIAGRWPSNCTSTTAPITWRTRPITLVAMVPSFVGWVGATARNPTIPIPAPSLGYGLRPNPTYIASQCLRARDDLDQLLGDHGLARAVVAQGQLVDHLAGVAGGAVHGAHARALLGGGVLEQAAEDLSGDVARQEIVQDLALVGLVLVDGAGRAHGLAAFGQLGRDQLQPRGL